MRVKTLAICLAATAVLGSTGMAQMDKIKQEAFEELCAQLQQRSDTMTAAEVIRVIDTGNELGQPYTVSIAIKNYMSRQQSPPPGLLRKTIDNALRVGDFRTAVARCKTYLKAAQPDAAAAEVAATLYATQIDFLGANDDAYRFMGADGLKFRRGPAVLKFDPWYLQHAQTVRSYKAYADRLLLVFQDKRPVEEERLHFRSQLDWLFNELRRSAEPKFAALPSARKIVGLIREDGRRKAYFQFIVAHASFKASAAGKEPERLEKEYLDVISAASQFMNAYPTLKTLREIIYVFEDGGFTQAASKRQFLVEAVGKLNPKERRAFIDSRYGQFTADNWIELARLHPAVFKLSPTSANVSFGSTVADPDVHRQRSAFLTGVPGREPGIINSLAAGGGLNGAADHLMKKESWHFDSFAQPYDMLNRTMWPTFRGFPRPADNPLPPDTYNKALVHFGSRYVSQSPVAFDKEAAMAYITAGWSHSDAVADKAKMVEHLHSLDWVPYTEKQRSYIVTPAYNAYKQWAEAQRQAAAAAEKEAAAAAAAIAALKKQLDAATKTRDSIDPAKANELDAATKAVNDLKAKAQAQGNAALDIEARIKAIALALAQISPLEEAFKHALAPASADPTKAPNDLARRLALAIQAVQAGDNAAYMKIAREIYPLVKDYDAKKLPMGRAILRYLVSPSQKMDIVDFQAEVLADQLTGWKPDGDNRRIQHVADAIMTSRPAWKWAQVPQADRERVLKLNAVIEKAVLANLGKGDDWRTLFNWLLGTRRGGGWDDRGLNLKVMEEIIAGKHMPVPEQMSYVSGYFSGLREKYPVKGSFDDAFIEQSKAANKLDINYWNRGGGDPDRKIRNLAATMLSSYGRLPFGGDGAVPEYSRDDYWRWYNYALDAEPPVRATMLDAVEGRYGKSRFDTSPMGYHSFRYRGENVNEPAGRTAYFKRIDDYLDKLSKAGNRMSTPYLYGLTPLKGKPESLTDDELTVLVRLVSPEVAPSRWHGGNYAEDMARTLHKALLAKERHEDLFVVAPQFWRIAKHGGDAAFRRDLITYSEDLLNDEQFNLAAVYSGIGLDVLGTGIPDVERSRLTVVRSRATGKIGGVIPVKKSDPRYPLFAAQADYFNGNYERAWDNYVTGRKLMPDVYQELDPVFCTWLVDRHTEAGQFAQSEELARSLIQWMDRKIGGFAPEVRLGILMAYANIAFTRPEYPRARAQYEAIIAADEFKDLRGQIDAELRITEVDRKSGRPGDAILRLEKLLERKDPYIQTEGHYHMAKVNMDMEAYADAKEHLQQVFAYDKTHEDAKILEGHLNLKMKLLEAATDIGVGLTADQEKIVPGKVLSVSVEDQTLGVIGRQTAIEVHAWTDSGDDEHFNLTPFADSRTEFKGQIGTELAPTRKGDHTLQVLGKDRVHYDFSEEFKKNQNITTDMSHSLTVVSDAGLYASSGKIMTQEEKRQKEMEDLIRQRLQIQQKEKGLAPLSTLRSAEQIKPGNKINLLVEDPDRSATAGKDTLRIQARTSSGDIVSGLELTETDTHSGSFIGLLPTESAPATAFATDSDEGSDPNFVISAGDYGPWVALPDSKKPKSFTVDLNDNRFLDVMQVVADVPGRKIRDMVLQVSQNGREYTTIGGWPTALEEWDGSPRGIIVRGHGDLEQVSMRDRRTIKMPGLVARWREDVFGQADALKISWDDPAEKKYTIRFSAAFYSPKRLSRTFRLVAANDNENVEYSMLIDGEVVEVEGEEGTDDALYPTYRGLMSKGVHRIDVIVRAIRRSQPSFEVLCDTEEPPYMAACPAAMFDPEVNPQIRQHGGIKPATITENIEAGSLDVAFGDGTRGRALRMVLHDFETDAPAINRIHLTAKDGEKILPTKTDLMELRKNQILEIVPGDSISIVYVDPTGVVRDGEEHEARLSATYSDANINANLLIGYLVDSTGLRIPQYAGLRRFKTNDSIDVAINDPDADISEKADQVTFTVQVFGSEPVEIEALETAENSGVFVGRIFPIAGEPTRKQEIKIVEGDDLVLAYMDKENTNPGVPWSRSTVIEQVWYQDPEFRVFDAVSQLIPVVEEPEDAPKLTNASFSDSDQEEIIPKRYQMLATRPEEIEVEGPTATVLRGPILAEVLWPTIAQSTVSKATIYVQSSAGRAAHPGGGTQEVFDVTVPGTIALETHCSASAPVPLPLGYSGCEVVGDRNAGDALDDGRFTFSVPTKPGTVPDESLVTLAAKKAEVGEDPPEMVLTLMPGDDVFIGFEYADEKGVTNWITRDMTLGPSGALFDAMDKKYRDDVEALYVGNSVYFRVIDPWSDGTVNRDAVSIDLEVSTGRSTNLVLTESFSHSGIFKGHVKLTYDEDETAVPEVGILPVKYGAKVTATYNPGEDRDPLERVISIHKGSDGTVMPFSKRFKDKTIAVRTQLAIAEAYFELAKKHRKLKQTELTQREIAEGKRILEEAIRDYPDNEARAQADYLLANLSLEFAEDEEDEEVQKQFFQEAIIRFTDIVANHRDSEYAPKSQYKKALSLEKIGDIDVACEEYVKLSYRWPNHELIAETIARLGQYFFLKGKDLKTRESAENDPVEQEKLRLQSLAMFTTAAEVFGRLAARFPNHKLAAKTTLLAGQCYMRAENYDKAVRSLITVVDNSKADKDVRAEAMYWCGDSYAKNKENVEAFRVWKKLTWDYPASIWAKYARGRLTEGQFAELDQ